MKEIEDIYREIILSSYYDEKFGGMQQEIDGEIHGVCIDFSRNLIRNLRNKGYSAGLISTLNDDGFLHAAVIYRDKVSGEVCIADPVTDVRLITGKKGEEKLDLIEELLNNRNYVRNIRSYYEEFGPITDYDDSEFEENGIGMPKVLRSNMTNRNEILSNPEVVEIEKRAAQIQSLRNINDVINVADTSTLLACQLLYEKGIDTFCSNYNEDTGYIDILINYNSLSDENKKIFLQLMENYPQNYEIKDMTQEFGYPELSGKNSSINDEIPMAICLGYNEHTISGINKEQQNLKMAELVKPFKKQVYKRGVYTREEILDNKHNKMNCNMIHKEPKACNSIVENTNEEIALNEGMIYSKKYDLFFEDEIKASRYMESLYRMEDDWRTNEEITAEAGIVYKYGMYFEDEKMAEEYSKKIERLKDSIEEKEDFTVTSKDIIETSKKKQIPMSLIEKFRNILTKAKQFFEGR